MAIVKPFLGGLGRLATLGILRASSELAINGDVSLDYDENITVSAVAKKTPTQMAAIASGTIYAYATRYAYKQAQLADRVVAVNSLMTFINKWLRKSIGETEQLVDEFVQILQSGFDSDIPADVFTDLRRNFTTKGDSVDALSNLLEVADDLNKGNVKVPASRINYAVIQVQGSAWGTGLEDEMAKVVKDLRKLGKVSATDPVLLREMADFLLIPTNDVSGLRFALVESKGMIQQYKFNLSGILANTDDVFTASGNGDFFTLRPRFFAADNLDEFMVNRRGFDEAIASVVDDTLKQQDRLLGKVDEAQIKSDKLAKAASPKWLTVANKLLWIDTVVWGITGAVDLLLNLWLPEEEQGIFADRWGISLVDEFLINPIWNFFFPPEVQEELFIDLINVLDDVAGFEAIVGITLGIFFEEFNAKLTFDVSGDGTGATMLDAIPPFEPEYILVAGFLAIVGFEIWKSLLLPSWAILTGSESI